MKNGRVEEWIERLQQEGYRQTAPRRAVVEVMAATHQVLSPAEVFDLAQEEYSRIGLVTVYRTIDKLEELGLIQRVHRSSGCQAFIAAAPGHQHLLVCRYCGHVEYFSGDRLDSLIHAVEGESGYQVEEHWLQLFGTCARCRKAIQ